MGYSPLTTILCELLSFVLGTIISNTPFLVLALILLESAALGKLMQR